MSRKFWESPSRWTEASKNTGIYGKTCIKACLEIEKSQVVCCSHPQNIYFMLNSNRIFHCASHILQICESFCLYFILCASQTKCVFFFEKTGNATLETLYNNWRSEQRRKLTTCIIHSHHHLLCYGMILKLIEI